MRSKTNARLQQLRLAAKENQAYSYNPGHHIALIDPLRSLTHLWLNQGNVHCELDHCLVNDGQLKIAVEGYGMCPWRIMLAVPMIVAIVIVQTLAAPFVVFPKAGELVSPDGRFVVRNAEREGSASDFVGTFHSLWLIEVATGRSRKLCDYLGVAAVAWSNNDFLVVTQYVDKKTSRALVFSAAGPEDPVMLDRPTLIRLVPAELRATLRENDHVFVEASRVEERTLHLRVWGYGQHDANGFRWRCEYVLREGVVSCTEERSSH